jgi:hypothetical protein
MRRSPSRRGRSDAIAGASRALSSALCLALAAGCASRAPLAAPVRGPLPAGDLRVELVFGQGADLDLYLTDPSQETVYYANSPSQVNGGRLEADLRCGAAPPRTETIVFRRAPPGRYRVGVDQAQTCDGGSAVEPFLVTVEAPGGERRELRGEIPRGRFLARVLEFTVVPEPAP